MGHIRELRRPRRYRRLFWADGAVAHQNWPARSCRHNEVGAEL